MLTGRINRSLVEVGEPTSRGFHMLRKISVAIAGSMLLSGVAAAASIFAVQPGPTFPMSVNDTGPNYPAVAAERKFG